MSTPSVASYDAALTASKLAVHALGIEPGGSSWPCETPLMCAMDAVPIRRGDTVARWKPGANFLDQQSTEASPVIGGHAAALTAKAVMQKAQRAVFCREGAFPLNTDAARAWFYLTPPEPPFAAVIATSTLQHLIWRTPVCWSREDIVLRLGPQLVRIRRPRLLDAVKILRDYDGPVFQRLDRQGADPAHGQFRRDVDPAIRQDLADLTPGELVALATLCKRNPVTPEKPDPIIL